jgi:hypothetical protein
VAVAAMSVSVRFEDNDRGDKEPVRSADSNRELQGEQRKRMQTDNLERKESNVEM